MPGKMGMDVVKDITLAPVKSVCIIGTYAQPD